MSGFKAEFSVLNLQASPGIYASSLATRPAAGYPGRIFIDTDNPSTGIYRDTGTVWVQIAQTSSTDTDTLQIVTDRGNTTTNSVSIGHAQTPLAIIDARTAFTSLVNQDSFCVAANTNKSIPNNATFSTNYVNTVYGFQSLSFQGNATIGNSGINSSGNFISFLNATLGGTITVSQSSTIRAIAGTTTGIYFNAASSPTFTHLAGYRTLQPLNTGSSTANITNYYGVLIADSTPSSGSLSFINRWGLYQEGTSDINYFAGNTLIKTTSNNGNALQVNGTADITGNLGIGTNSPAEKIHISGTNPFVQFSNTGTTAAGLYYASINGDAYIVQTGSTNAVITGTVAGSLAYRTASKSQLWSVDGGTNAAMTLDASGNLGIGTTSPVEALNIYRGAVQNAFIEIAAGGRTIGTNSFMIGQGYGGEAYIYQRENNLLYFATNSTERMRITSGGNVLINTTTNSGQKLYLNGSFRIDGQTSGTAGGSSGQHLIINCDGTDYKIALLNV